MKLFPKDFLPIANVVRFVVIFYAVGTIGFLLPFSRDIFMLLTPLALIISTYLLMIYHGAFNSRDIVLFGVIFILGVVIEIIGVHTGLVFGSYTYGSALGPKVMGTPLLIGVNWLFLAYTCTSVASRLKISKWLVYLVAPSLMVGYDLVLEQVAPAMDMWSWAGGEIPLQNYIAWWVIGFLFCGLLNLFKVNTNNPLALPLLLSQFFFFVILAILMV